MCSCARMLALEWKERAFIEKVNSKFFCWFPVAIFEYQNCPQIWHLHTQLYSRSCWNTDHADCGLQTVQTVQTESYFSYLYLNFLIIKNFYHSFPQERARWRKVSCFIFVTVLYCHDYLIFFNRRSFFRLSDL